MFARIEKLHNPIFNNQIISRIISSRRISELSREFSRKYNFIPGQYYGIKDFEIIQKTEEFNDYNIIIYKLGDGLKTIIFGNKDRSLDQSDDFDEETNKNDIYVTIHDGHWYLITSLPAFYGCDKFCSKYF